ncbi:hypothetical protein EVAR_91603_1 [Eumeta japonica]|uniref:Uncharacterized protein n=1 Tax=Eumeta variegata TaxID=151549 RepID=A0A4C1UY35_EUMVA|nr:hypothetical protein EVAR_91603_1 [Eumeta japonica]
MSFISSLISHVGDVPSRGVLCAIMRYISKPVTCFVHNSTQGRIEVGSGQAAAARAPARSSEMCSGLDMRMATAYCAPQINRPAKPLRLPLKEKNIWNVNH